MKCGYDDLPKFELSSKAIEAIETLGSELCRLQQKADTEYADCWEAFRWRIDNDLQPEFAFGSLKDVRDMGRSGGRLVIVTPDPDPPKPRRKEK